MGMQVKAPRLLAACMRVLSVQRVLDLLQGGTRMKRLQVAIGVAVLIVVTMGCSFSQFTQSEKLTENIDDYRTGCEVDAETLMTEYKQWEANRWHFDPDDSTPTPSPICLLYTSPSPRDS